MVQNGSVKAGTPPSVGRRTVMHFVPHLPGEGCRILCQMRGSSSCSSFSFAFRRTSFVRSWSQWSSPDLICQLLIAVVVAGPHLPALDLSGRRRTSSASSPSHWASPDFNRRESERCGPRRTSTGESLSAWRRTSTGESLSAVGLAGLQPARFGAPWASPDFNRTSTAGNKAI